VVLGRLASGGAKDFRTWLGQGGCRALEQAFSRSREEVVRIIELSGLRGRGGAGFPTGRKWRAVSQQPGPEKFVIANADEGDAGA
jgi:NADH:ubiquinone oxidoreductase subunit F (NADH-binding)